MPFDRPALDALVEEIKADIEINLPGADARARRSILSVLATADAALVHGVYDFESFIARQVFADTAEAEFLERQAGVFGVSRGAAVTATGDVEFSGTDGADIPLGAALQSAEGAEYTTTAAVIIAGGIASAPVIAAQGGGGANADAGAQLSFVSPIANVASQALVATGGLTGGLDVEADERLRARLLERIQQPPAGGALHDYSAWTLAQTEHGAPVTRAFIDTTNAADSLVYIRFTIDDDPEGPIPTAQHVADVQAFIDTMRPVTATPIVVAPIAAPLAFSINISPNNAAVQAAITAELTDLLRREATPGGTLLVSHIREAISVAAGEADHALVAPVADVVSATGDLATLGDLTWGAL